MKLEGECEGEGCRGWGGLALGCSQGAVTIQYYQYDVVILVLVDQQWLVEVEKITN